MFLPSNKLKQEVIHMSDNSFLNSAAFFHIFIYHVSSSIESDWSYTTLWWSKWTRNCEERWIIKGYVLLILSFILIYLNFCVQLEDFSLYLLHQKMELGAQGLFHFDNTLYHSVCFLIFPLGNKPWIRLFLFPRVGYHGHHFVPNNIHSIQDRSGIAYYSFHHWN